MSNILFIDLEATCWEQDAEYQKEHTEIIEVGYCAFDSVNGGEVYSDSFYVKPQHSEISEYCTFLTGITDETVKDAGTFPEVYEELMAFIKRNKITKWYSWGEFDRTQLIKDCKRYDLDYTWFSMNHINLKRVYKDLRDKSMGMKRALREEELQMKGRHHSGKDDAYNISRIYEKLMTNGR